MRPSAERGSTEASRPSVNKRIFVLAFSIVLMFCASTIEAKSKKKRIRRPVVVKPDPPRPDELKPVREDRFNQNKIAEQLGIPTIWDDKALAQLKLPQEKRTDSRVASSKYRLVPPKHSKYYTVSSGAYTYSWVNDFLEKLFDQKAYQESGVKPIINSFARTLQRQRSMTMPCLRYVKVRRGRNRGQLRCVRNPSYNPHAASVDDPDGFSLHTRAVAIDISRKNLNTAQIFWMRQKLIELKKQNIGVFPIEEQRSGSSVYKINCFHVVIFDPAAYQALKDSNKSKDVTTQ